MSDGIWSALSGAIAQERSLNIAANNVANVETAGYQGDKPVFAEVMAKALQAVPSNQLHYVAIQDIAIDQSQGSLQKTDNPLDVALQGEGFFALRTPGGERYTRDGSFALDGEGTLRTKDGLEVLGEAGPAGAPGIQLSIPEGTKEIQISEDGSVLADGANVGKLKLVTFPPQGLQKQGLTLFAPINGATPRAAEKTTVAQGYIEDSNVNAVSAMNELITVGRAFDAFQKVIESYRDIDQRTARDVGGR